jgi:hypothetical protein
MLLRCFKENDATQFQLTDERCGKKFSLETIGLICQVEGSTILMKKNKETISNFSFSVDSAKDITINNANDLLLLPGAIEATQQYVIRASNFDPSLPVDSITIHLCSSLLTNSESSTKEKKEVFLMKASIQFKDLSHKFDERKNIEFETSIKKITLFNAELSIPNSTTVDEKNFRVDERSNQQELFELKVNRFFSYSKYFITLLLLINLLVYIIYVLYSTINNENDVHYTKNLQIINYSLFTLFILFVFLFIILSPFFLTTLEHFFPFLKLVSIKKSNDRAFFVNGWNAWSACGAILQGQKLAMYSLPDFFVRSFHDGSSGSIDINLGFFKTIFFIFMFFFMCSVYINIYFCVLFYLFFCN